MSPLYTRALAVFAAIGALFVGTTQAAQTPQPDYVPPPDEPGGNDQLVPLEDWPAPATQIAPDQAARNVSAFLSMIAKAEGTINGPNNGYDVLFGWPAAGRTFDANAAINDHPRLKFPFTDKTGKSNLSSAAGRYQINAPTYDDFVPKRGLMRGFTPAHQDAIVIGILERDGALNDVRAGRLPQAIATARRRWASLPGAGYNQPERSLDYITAAYINFGGAVA